MGIFALVIAAWFLGPRRALPVAAGGLTFAPAIAAYWPIGYVQEEGGRNLLPPDPFSFDYGLRNWSDSLLFGPRTLLLLVPLAVLGALLLRRRRFELALLGAFVLGNVAVYTFYEPTDVHPRFFFSSLPPLFVLWAAGVVGVADRSRGT